MIRAVVFDLDGVLIDSEQLWDQARREVAAEHHGRWRDGATAAMMGMSSPEWSRYMHEALGVDLPPERISDLVVEKILARYRSGLPLLPGASDAVQRLSRRWPLALASSANRRIIDAVLDVAGWREAFSATVSSEEVLHGKPAPDVYTEAVRQLGQQPGDCAAVEDSANGVRSAVAAGLHVIAVPSPRFPPPGDVLAEADLVLHSLQDLSPEKLDELST